MCFKVQLIAGKAHQIEPGLNFSTDNRLPFLPAISCKCVILLAMLPYVCKQKPSRTREHLPTDFLPRVLVCMPGLGQLTALALEVVKEVQVAAKAWSVMRR